MKHNSSIRSIGSCSSICSSSCIVTSTSSFSTTYVETSLFEHAIVRNQHLSTICTVSSRICVIGAIESVSRISSISSTCVNVIIPNIPCVQMESINVRDCVSSFSRHSITRISPVSTAIYSLSTTSSLSNGVLCAI